MTNVIKFKSRIADDVDTDFLQHEDDKLPFDGKNYLPLIEKSSSQNSLYNPQHKKDWGNEELALLFRIKRILDLANLPTAIDRGITDDGDPWFLFCGHNENVFIHICRIDGEYIMDSPGLIEPLRGLNFEEIITDFLAKTSNKETHDTLKVLPFERAGKIYLHPSALLAALVWTLLVSLEDNVLLAPSDLNEVEPSGEEKLHQMINEMGEQIAVQNAPHITTESDPDEFKKLFVPASLQSHDDITCQGQNEIDASEKIQSRFQPEQALHGDVGSSTRSMSPAHECKNNSNIFGLSLAVISLAIGFKSSEALTNYNTDITKTFLTMLHLPSDSIPKTNEFNENLVESSNKLIAVFSSLLYAMEIENDVILENVKFSAANQSIAAELKDIIRGISSEQGISPNQIKNENVLHSLNLERNETDPQVVLSKESKEVTPEEIKSLEKADILNELDQENYNIGELFSNLMASTPFVRSNFPDVKEYSLNDMSVFASFNINEDEFSTASELAQLPSLEGNTSTSSTERSYEVDTKEVRALDLYDDIATQFMSFLHEKEGDLEVIAIENEIIFIDRDIFHVRSDETYAKSWSMENGNTISVIGLQSDYDQFLLIA